MRIVAHLVSPPGRPLPRPDTLAMIDERRFASLGHAASLQLAAPRADGRGALLVFEANSVDRLRAAIAALPSVRSGLATVEWIVLEGGCDRG